jgi:predicted PhzF superfamily epimerase YddE/YHI9
MSTSKDSISVHNIIPLLSLENEKKVQVNILRVFINKEGKYGNPTGTIVDVEQNLSHTDRQRIATKLRFTDIPETILI